MKKILIVFLGFMLFVYIFLISYADYGTNVVYMGNASEEYTVTVPAKMVPNGYGDVIVEGTWASNRQVNVTSDEYVELVNSINILNKKTLDVNFLGIHANGDDLNSKKIKETILVSDLDSEVLFGEWRGRFDYSVEIVDESNELYYGRVYADIFNVNEEDICDIVIYEDMSVLEIYSEYDFYKSEAGILRIDGNKIYDYSDDELTFISEDKKTLTKKVLSTDEINGIWELKESDDVLDNSFPITVDVADIVDNYKFDLFGYDVIKFSDMILSEQELSNLKMTGEMLGEFMTSYSSDSYCFVKSICSSDLNIISVKEVAVVFDDILILEPGLYAPFHPDMLDIDFNFELTIDDEVRESIEWNTLDVKNNKTLILDEHELVKVSDEVMDYEFYKFKPMNIVVDGNMITFDYSSTQPYNNIFKYNYSNDSSGYTYLVVVNEPGEYYGTYFDEVGVYAFNFGGVGKNYNIKIGKQHSPTFNNNIVLNSDYIYKENVIQFRFDGVEYPYTYNGVTYSNQAASADGNILVMNNGARGIVSKDGKKIKYYKYLSSSFFEGEEDDVTFVLSE